MSWAKASRETRQMLFKLIDNERIDEGFSWEEIILQSIGLTAYSDSFLRNFRRGVMGRKNCQKLHIWLRQVNWQAADEIDIKLSHDADTSFHELICKKKSRTVTEIWTYEGERDGVPIFAKETKYSWYVSRK